MRSTVLTALLFVCGVSNAGFSTALGQQAGDRILVTGDDAQLRSQSSSTGTVPKGALLTVRESNGEWLWVHYQSGTKGIKGWLNRRHALPIDQALNFIQAELQTQPNAELYNVRG